MSKLTELVREQTTLDREQIGHLNRLVSEWGMLADFCFSVDGIAISQAEDSVCAGLCRQ